MDDFVIFCILLAGGVIWGGTTAYCIRVRDHAASIETTFRKQFSVIDYVVELIVAGFIGSLWAIGLYGAGFSSPVVIGVSALAASINRSFFQLAAKYGPVISAHVSGGNGAAILRDKKLEELERAKILETRVEERIRIQGLIDDLEADSKNFD